MTKPALAAALVTLALAACAKPAPTCPVAPTLATAEDLDAVVARACACTDQTCEDAVRAEAKQLVGTMESLDNLDERLGACAYRARLAVTELEQLRDAACACTDVGCATQVQAEFDRFLERHKDTKGSQSMAEKVGALANEMSSCLGKVVGAE